MTVIFLYVSVKYMTTKNTKSTISVTTSEIMQVSINDQIFTLSREDAQHLYNALARALSVFTHNELKNIEYRPGYYSNIPSTSAGKLPPNPIVTCTNTPFWIHQ